MRMVEFSELPPGWTLCSIGDLVAHDGVFTDGDWVESKDQDPNGGVRLIQLADVGDGCFHDKSSRFLTKAKAAELNCTFLKKGDLLIARMPDPLGRCCIFPFDGDEKYVTVVDVCAVRLGSSQVDPRYLMYLVNSPEVRSDIEALKSGSTRKRISRKNLATIRLPLAPQIEQHRIVGVIEELFSELDKGVESLKTAREQLRVYRQSLLKCAFGGELTADWRSAQGVCLTSVQHMLDTVEPPAQPKGGRAPSQSIIDGRGAISVNRPSRQPPNGWEWVPLLRVARQETGHTPSRNFPDYWDNGDVPWIGIADARKHHGKVIEETVQRCTSNGLKNSSARLLPKGTVCLSRTASVGYVCIMGREMATSQDFATWTCSEALNPFYLMYALIAEGEHIRQFGKGTTHTTIYFPEIRALHICLPSLEEQKEIVALVERNIQMIDRVDKEFSDELARVDVLRQSILKSAFGGKLVAQDSNDEPASALLDRISAEKAKQGRKTKKKRKDAA